MSQIQQIFSKAHFSVLSLLITHTCTCSHGRKGKFQLSLKGLWKNLTCSNHMTIEKNTWI